MRTRSILAAIAALAIVATPVFAAGPFAQVDTGSSSIDFRPMASDVSLKLTVAGPEGFLFEKTFDAGDGASFGLFDGSGSFRADGVYNWQLQAVVETTVAQRDQMADLRASGADAGTLQKAGKLPAGFEAMSGSFAIAQGAIVAGGDSEPGAGGDGVNRLAQKATVLATNDGVIQDGLCVGGDCPTSPSFGFDTVRLQENNLRLHFQDTSNSGSFPTSDWRIVANDSANGGESYLAFEDSDAGTMPFKVRNGAGNNALYVHTNGNVGLNTNTPVLQLQITDGNSPGLRLEQNGSAGFTAQTFDIAANEANFFVRDVTNGSQLPFKILPGADNNSLVIAADNDIGIGVLNPTSAVHVLQNTDANESITIENNNTGLSAAAIMKVDSDSAGMNFTAHGSGRTGTVRFGETMGSWNELLAFSGNGLIIGTSNNNSRIILGTDNINVLEITADQRVLYQGVQVHADYVFEPDYAMPSIDEQAEYMFSNKHLPAIGAAQFTEDGREVMELGSDRQGIVEELEKAHVFIAQLNDRLEDKNDQVDELQERLERLESLLSQQ